MIRPPLPRLLAISWLAVATIPAASQAAVNCRERTPADLVTLESPGSPLIAAIAPSRGGEMVSLRLRQQDAEREILYRGGNFCKAAGFEGKAPVLWPATGRTYLPDSPGQKPRRGWLWNGRTYDMPLHGFARALPWRIVDQRRDKAVSSVTLELIDTAETRRHYPFGFNFQLRYILRGSTIAVEHRIRAANGNRDAMPFALGNHIAFILPSSGATLSTPASRRLLLDEEARPTGQAEAIAPIKNASVAVFSNRPAVPLAGYSARPAARLDLSDGLSIRIDHRGSTPPLGDPVGFNMWGDLKKGFFSPEPWWGKQNALATGDGAVRLEPGATFEWTFKVTVKTKRKR